MRILDPARPKLSWFCTRGRPEIQAEAPAVERRGRPFPVSRFPFPSSSSTDAESSFFHGRRYNIHTCSAFVTELLRRHRVSIRGTLSPESVGTFPFPLVARCSLLLGFPTTRGRTSSAAPSRIPRESSDETGPDGTGRDGTGRDGTIRRKPLRITLSGVAVLPRRKENDGNSNEEARRDGSR